VKTRFEIEEEKAAQSDARCLFFEHQRLFQEVARAENRVVTLNYMLRFLDTGDYANHGNCLAYDVFLKTLLELIDQHDQN
jgi:hypothetical protein